MASAVGNDEKTNIEEAAGPRRWTLSRLATAGWALLIISLIFSTQFFFIGRIPFALSDIIFLIAAALWLAAFVAGNRRFRWHWLYWVLLVFLAVFTASAIFSADKTFAFRKLLEVIYLIALCVVTASAIRNEDDLRTLSLAWIAGTAVACLIGIFALATFYADPGFELLKYVTAPYGAVPVGNYPRLAIGFPSASMFCNYLNVSLMFVLIAERTNWIGRKIFAALFLSILLCSVFTFSAGLGGVFLALGVWLWFVLRNENPWVARMCIAAGVAIAVASYLVTLVALQPYSTAPYSIILPWVGMQIQPSPRILIWTQALRTFVDNFWTGAGIGTHAANVLFQNTDGSNSRLLDAHNIFLNIAAQTGIAGLIAVFALCVAVLRVSIARTFSFILYGLGVAFLCSFVYQGLTGSFEHARHLWVLIGMIIAADRIMQATKTLPPHEEGLHASHRPSAIEARSA